MWIRRGRNLLPLSPVRPSPSSSDLEVTNVPREIESSIRFEDKESCMLPNSSQMETFEGGHGENNINKKRSIREACNDERDMYSPSAGAFDLLALSLSSSSQVFEEEVDKPIPFKKRLTSYMKAEEEQIMEKEEEKEGKGKGKGKATITLIENGDKKVMKKTMKMMKKKKKKMGKKQKGLSLMEGSRCSRVNGRGWRCNQKTLVGYALCQHHLGMARIRSVNSFSGGTRKGGSGDSNSNGDN